MRNPERIPTLLNLLKELWEMSPDQRFNQFLHNLQWEYFKETGKGVVCANYNKDSLGFLHLGETTVDLFNVEDDEFIGWLEMTLRYFKYK
jgi:hypothetical protein